jgi:hypothetical protein
LPIHRAVWCQLKQLLEQRAMASKRLRAQIEDELRTLYVCPVVFNQQRELCLTGQHLEHAAPVLWGYAVC